MPQRFGPRALGLAAALLSVLALSDAALAARSRHADVWTFGTNCRLTWNADATSVSFTTGSATATIEGCASFSDPTTGALLIYTDGHNVWNGASQSIASDLPGDSSSMHSGVIVPHPGSPGNVYVFAHQSTTSTFVSYREFHIVSASDVTQVGSVQNIDVGSGLGREGLLVIPHANGVDYWLLISGVDQIHVLPVTSSGLGSDTTTPSGVSVWNQGWHLFTASHQGDRVVISGNISGGTNNGEIASFDFNRATGALTNRTVLNPGYAFDRRQYYGGVFSPSGRRLYFASLTEGEPDLGRFYQYDYDTGVFTTLSTNGTQYTYGDGRLGPDGKIYVAGDNSHGVHVIADPDAAGAACGFTYNALTQPTGCTVGLGLPQVPSPLVAVQLDLAVNVNAPVGTHYAGTISTVSGSAQAPNGATVHVVVTEDGSQVAACDATVASAAWSCAGAPVAGLPVGEYVISATVTYDATSASTTANLRLIKAECYDDPADQDCVSEVVYVAVAGPNGTTGTGRCLHTGATVTCDTNPDGTLKVYPYAWCPAEVTP